MACRSAYLFQLNGIKRFFTRVPTIFLLSSISLGFLAVLVSFAHYFVDMFYSYHLLINNINLFSLGKYVVKERFCLAMWALFTTFTVLRMTFISFLMNSTSVLIPTLYYTIEICFLLFAISIASTLLIFDYISKIIQSPAIMNWALFSPISLDLSQLHKNLMFPEKESLSFLVCLFSSVVFLFVRLMILYFFAIAHYNRTANLFNVISKRSLAAIIFDHKFRKYVRFRGGSDDIKGLLLKNFTKKKYFNLNK